MRLFTSSSKPAALLYAKVLIWICAALALGFEIGANYLLKHYSSTYQRVSQQYAAAVRVRSFTTGTPTSILMVGNSLLLAGVDVERLHRLTYNSLHVYPIFLEATGYYDWFYGLQRLFRQGAKPQIVMVGLPADYFLEATVRPEYSPMMLLDARDILRLASDLGLDRTTASNLLLAHLSAFWNARTIFRAQILRGLIPHFDDLFALIKPKGASRNDSEFETLGVSRLQTLRALCEAHGARLIVVIPPTPASENGIRRLGIASRRAGVQTLVPIDPEMLSAGFYEPDATHLNAKGAAVFTSALAVHLTTLALDQPAVSQK